MKLQVVSAKFNVLAAQADFLAAGEENATAMESAMKTSEVLLRTAEIDAAAASAGVSEVEEAEFTVTGIDNSMELRKKSIDIQTAIEHRRQITGDFSSIRDDKNLVALAFQAKVEMTAALSNLITAFEDFTLEFKERTSRTVTLSATDVKRDAAVRTRAKAMLDVQNARASLLASKALLESRRSKWSQSDPI